MIAGEQFVEFIPRIQIKMLLKYHGNLIQLLLW